MTKIITYLLLPLLFSCATSSVRIQNLENSKGNYNYILTCIVDKPITFHAFDSAFYDSSVKEQFNNLRNIEVRSQMEKTLKRNLGNISNLIVPSSDLFVTNEVVSYSRFKEGMEKSSIEAILLISEESTWETNSYVNSGYSVRQVSQPNTAFHCYLVDAKSGKIIWLGRFVVRGLVAGYDTLNNKLAKKLAKKLREGGYIL